MNLDEFARDGPADPSRGNARYAKAMCFQHRPPFRVAQKVVGRQALALESPVGPGSSHNVTGLLLKESVWLEASETPSSFADSDEPPFDTPLVPTYNSAALNVTNH